MRLIYHGPHPEVVVDELDPELVIVAGEPVNVPDELGARLLQQDTWSDSSDDTSSAAQKVREAAEAKAAAEAQADAEAAKQAEATNATKGDS